jgi:hypothetical protein
LLFWNVILCTMATKCSIFTYLHCFLRVKIWRNHKKFEMTIILVFYCYLLYKNAHIGYFGMSFCVLWPQNTQYLLSYFVFHEWKYGTIIRNLKWVITQSRCTLLVIPCIRTPTFVILECHFVYYGPKMLSIYLFTLFFVSENMVQS